MKKNSESGILHKSTYNFDKKVPLESIPLEAYLYFPKENEIMIVHDKKTIRRIFEGQIKFLDWEEKLLTEYKQFLTTSKMDLDISWENKKILRFLYANNWKFDKTHKSMFEYIQWKKEKLPPELTMNNSGILYVHGRDHRFRPIIVFNAYLINLDSMDVDMLLDGITYVLVYVIENLMLPGQVENWIFIIDLNKVGLTNLPLATMKKVISYMQNNFRSRLFVMYIIKAPFSINFFWSMVKGFLEEHTQRKIQIISKAIPANLLTHANMDQIQEKHGGNCPNLKDRFWPPILPTKNFFVKNDDAKDILITKEKYIEMFKSGELIHNRICDEFVHEKKEEKDSEQNALKKIEQTKTMEFSQFKKYEQSNDDKIWNFIELIIANEEVLIPKIKIFPVKENFKYVLENSAKFKKKQKK